MSEKFQVGQWVTLSDGRICNLASVDDNGGYVVTENVRPNENTQRWVGRHLMKPFRWKIKHTYRTTLDGVTAKVDATASRRVWVDCKWRNVDERIHANNFHDTTGKLVGFEERTDVPHLLPFLADESPPVAEAATEFSEFETDESDDVNSPPHYTSHPSGIECITITEAFNFNVGNAIKYLWRAGLKDDALQDLRKAAWYVQREIERRERAGK